MLFKHSRHFIITIALLSAIALIFCLAGCGALMSQSEVKHEIHASFPKSELISFTQGTNSKDQSLEYAEYVYENKEIRFKVINSQYYSYYHIKCASLSIDYMEQLMAELQPALKDISDDIEEKFHLQFSLDIHKGLEWGIIFVLQEASALSNVNKALDEIRQLVADYLPTGKSTSLGTPMLTVYLKAPCQNGEEYVFYSVTMPAGADDQFILDDPMVLEADYLMKNAAREGKIVISDLTAQDVEDIPCARSNGNMYIDGKQFTSDRYHDIDIVYNPADRSYYLPVIFALDIEYNGGVQDYVQREIINSLYCDADYTIITGKKTTYRIGNDEFVVTKREKADGYSEYTFYKNGKDLHITGYDELMHGEYHTGATYMVMISADDYAKLIGCTVESIDYKTASIFFVTN